MSSATCGSWSRAAKRRKRQRQSWSKACSVLLKRGTPRLVAPTPTMLIRTEAAAPPAPKKPRKGGGAGSVAKRE
eukprot:9529284-Alexandrium_andersonii.AAC.1